MKLSLCLLVLVSTGVISKSIDETGEIKTSLKKLLHELKAANKHDKQEKKTIMDAEVQTVMKKTFQDLYDLKAALKKEAKTEHVNWRKELQEQLREYSGNGDGANGYDDEDDDKDDDDHHHDGHRGDDDDDGDSEKGDNGGNYEENDDEQLDIDDGTSERMRGKCGISKYHTGSIHKRSVVDDRSVLDDLETLLRDYTQKENLDTKVVNGETAKLAEFPWVVALFFDGDSVPDCGGSLISPNWVLTAAHCLDMYKKSECPGRVSVRVGEHSLTDRADQKHRDHKVDRCILHEEYDTDTDINDIALLRLGKPVAMMRNHIGEVCLSETPFDDHPTCVVAGWGVTAFGDDDVSDVLLKAKIKLVNTRRCGGLLDTQLCGRGVGGTSKEVPDACQGDSGGPLFCKRRFMDGRVRFVQTGIVSYGGKCGDPDVPGVYTNVHQYISWINARIH